MELRAVCSDKAMTARMANCRFGNGDCPCSEPLDSLRDFWPPSFEEGGDKEGG